VSTPLTPGECPILLEFKDRDANMRKFRQ